MTKFSLLSKLKIFSKFLLKSRCSTRRPTPNFVVISYVVIICCYQIFATFSLLPRYIRQLLISRSSYHCLLHRPTTFHSTGLQSQAIISQFPQSTVFLSLAKCTYPLSAFILPVSSYISNFCLILIMV